MSNWNGILLIAAYYSCKQMERNLSLSFILCLIVGSVCRGIVMLDLSFNSYSDSYNNYYILSC